MNTPTMMSGEEITLLDVLVKLRRAIRFFWSERILLAKYIGLACAVGVFIGLGSPVEYSAGMRILPYRGSAGGGAGLSGLAGLAGIRLQTGTTDLTITADLYPEIAKGLDFRIAVAETPLRFSTLRRKVSAVEYLKEIRKPSITETLASYSFGLPGRLISLFSRGETKLKDDLQGDTDSTTLRQYDQGYLSLVGGIGSRVSIKTDQLTGVYLISARMPDPYAAADLVRVSAERLMKQISEYESQKAAKTFHFVNEQYMRAKVRYEQTQRELANFTDRNRALMSATSQIDRDRLQREYDVAFEVYQQFSRELEQARVKLNQDTPVFTVLDQVIVPNVRTSPNRKRIVFFSMLFGAVVGGVQLGIRQILASSNFKRKPESPQKS